MANDDELADVLIQLPEQPVAHRRMSDWSPDVEMLTLLHDRVCELIQVTVAVAGGKPRPSTFSLRPVTAMDRARERRRLARHRSIVARVLPPTAEDSPPAG